MPAKDYYMSSLMVDPNKTNKSQNVTFEESPNHLQSSDVFRDRKMKWKPTPYDRMDKRFKQLLKKSFEHNKKM